MTDAFPLGLRPGEVGRRSRRHRSRLLAAGVALCAALTGCADVTAVPESIPASRSWPVTGEPSPAPPRPDSGTPVPGTAEPQQAHADAGCGVRGGLAIGFSPVEAALGSRYLTATVVNCTGHALTVPEAVPVEPRDSAGLPVEITWELRPAIGGTVMEPGETRYLHLKWRSSGRCERGAATLTISLEGSRATVDDCFQLGGLVGAEAGAAVWSNARWNPL